MKNVLLIDSGSGGVNVLKACVNAAPCCNFLFFCDNKNLPYGSKSQEELCQITLQNLKDIRKFFHFDIVILACNTLTAACIKRCREEFFDVIFVGTEPAVAPALRKYPPNDILVLATPATIKFSKILGGAKGVMLKEMPTLASEIDKNLCDLSVLNGKICEELFGLRPKAVVLGCTHYLAVSKAIVDALGGEVEVFDGAKGVARRLCQFVSNDGAKSLQVQMMTSANFEFLPLLWGYFWTK